MFRRHGDKLSAVFLICDLLVTAVSWVAAYLIRFSPLAAPQEIPDFSWCLRALPLVVLLAAFSYRACGLYEIHRLHAITKELATLMRAGGLLFALSITITFYRRDPYESRLALGIFLILNIALLAVARRIVWRALRWFRHQGYNNGRALVVGTGRIAHKTVAALRRNDWTGLEIIGYVGHSSAGRSADLPVLGTIEDLPELVESQAIDFVFVALPLSQAKELKRVHAVLADVLVDVQWVPDIPNLSGMSLRSSTINGLAFVGLRESPHYGWNLFVKRVTDIVVGTVALVAFAPVMAVSAALVLLTSRGPVFYRQERVGLGGKPFKMIKFRTMRIDAEHTSGPVWATPHDNRCTPVGKFLRQTSLDELPQLFNVLSGKMSLVGPRPERPFFIDRFRHNIPSYMLRHTVKAGITGWAQVHGWRGNTSLRKRVQYDLYYISHWSLWLDLRILVLTVLRGFRNENAY